MLEILKAKCIKALGGMAAKERVEGEVFERRRVKGGGYLWWDNRLRVFNSGEWELLSICWRNHLLDGADLIYATHKGNLEKRYTLRFVRLIACILQEEFMR